MHTKEKTAVSSLAVIMAFRMLGLFMILPVFSLYVGKIPHATPFLIGLALGIYGLTQACLQAPFGMLSDRIGRKPVIAAGLLLFALGSIVAGCSHSIYGIVFGRALQGTGAIGSTTLAMVADLTRDEERSKAMAILGMSIGLSFSIAMIIGPIINAWFHLNGIFWTTAILAGIGLLLLFTVVPTPPRITTPHPQAPSSRSNLHTVLKNTQLLRLNLGIFVLHSMLTAMFIAIPIMLTHMAKLNQHAQVLLYLIVLVCAFSVTVPLIIIAEKQRKMKPLFVAAIGALILAQLLLIAFHHSAIDIGIILLLFFAAFTLLEASLPSLVSKISPLHKKGTAMGIYSTAQFFGIFIGGSSGGLIFSHFHIIGIFIFCAILGIIWLIAAVTMAQPPYLSTLIFKISATNESNIDSLHDNLQRIPGVNDVAIMPHEQLIYIKADKKIIPEHELRKLLRQSNLLYIQ